MSTSFMRGTCPGVKWRLMGRAEQNARVFFNKILRAIPVMHIKIDNRDAFQTVMFQRIFCCNRDIPELKQVIQQHHEPKWIQGDVGPSRRNAFYSKRTWADVSRAT